MPPHPPRDARPLRRRAVQRGLAALRATLDGALDAPLACRTFELAVGAALCCRNGRRSTPLHVAAISGDDAAAELLLDLGASPRLKDAKGCQPLHRALWFGHEAVVRLLLQRYTLPGAALHGLSLHEANHALERPLYIAALRGHPRCVELLLQQQGGGSILEDVEYCDGYSPLHAAAITKNITIIDALLAAGFSPDSPNKYGQTPLHLAASGSCRLDHQLAAVERLLLAGADATLADERGLTPALVAKAHGRDEVFEVLKAAAPAAAEGDGGKKKRRRRRGGPR